MNDSSKLLKIMILVFPLLILPLPALAEAFLVNGEDSFNSGNYSGTAYNSTGGYLHIEYPALAGNYSSTIFDGSGLASWNNITWLTDVCYQCALPNNLAVESGDFLTPINMSQNQLLWHLDESSGNVADSSGNSHNGIVHGTSLGNIGKFNKSAYFDGNDWIAMNMSYSSSVTLDNLTVCGWFKVGPSEGLWSIVDFDRSEFYNLEVGRQKANVLNFATTGTNNVIHDMGGTTNVMDNEWHLGCGMYNVTDKIIYVDGKEDYRVSNPHGGRSIGSGRYDRWGFVGDGSEASSFDGNRNNIYFTGYLDEIAIWNRSLSPTEIENLYRRGALRLNLTARYCDDSQCDGESYQDINDTSPQSINLSNSNFFQFKAELQTDSASISPRVYNLTLHYSPLMKVHWIKAYSDGNVRYFTDLNNTLRIKAKVQYDPELTIISPSGSSVVADANMTNETQPENNIATWYYDFTPNETGWYTVGIAGKNYSHTMFIGTPWQDNQTDSDGHTYPFRITLNISDEAAIQRPVEIVDINLNFTYKAANNSILVAAATNSTQLVTLPSQVYNKSYAGNEITNANVVFPVSLNDSETAQYYIYYSRTSSNSSSLEAGLNVVNETSNIIFENSRYKVNASLSQGGVIKDLFSRHGTEANLAGFSPAQLSPSVSVGPYTYRASDVSTPITRLNSGTLLTQYNTTGTAGTIDFVISYTFYALLPYYTVCTSVTARSSETWSNYQDHNYYLTDGYFTYAEWKNSSSTAGFSIGSQDGSDQTELGNLTWITAYNNATGNALGAIFISDSSTITPAYDAAFYDDTDYEHFSRQLFAGAVTSGDRLNSTSAIAFHNGNRNSEELSQIAQQIFNPAAVIIHEHITFDSIYPTYSTSNYTPQTLYDNQSVTCYSYWQDNIELDYAIISVNSTGFSNQSTINITSNESWVNITLNTTTLGAGEAQCSITVFDISGQQNSTLLAFNISDAMPPRLVTLNHTPNDNASLDPNVTINITSVIEEFTNVSTAILQYRNNSNETWTNKTMHRMSASLPNFTYTSNFTAITSGLWQYQIIANDTYNNLLTTDSQNVSVYYDLTWNSTPPDFGALSAFLDENVTLGNITITNTGDLNLNLSISSNWADNQEIYYNSTAEGDTGYSLILSSQSSINISVIVRAASVERTDDLRIRVQAQNGSATPSAAYSNATIISYASGPYLYVSFVDTPASVTQGNSGVSVIAKVQNKGNESATNPWVYLDLPEGWSVTSGNQNTTVSTLEVDEELYNTLSVSISGSASTGVQNLSALAGCDENKSGSASTITVVVAQTTQSPVQAPTGGGGGGGSSRVPLPKLTTNETNESDQGSIIDTVLRGQEILASSESFELVRGEKESFEITVTNIFPGTTFKDVTMLVEGYLSDYMSITPEAIEEIKYDSSASFIVTIGSAQYMEKGVHQLDMVIKGQIVGPGINKRLLDTRKVNLWIHTVSRDTAESQIQSARSSIQSMKVTGFSTERVNSLLSESLNALDSKDYDQAMNLATEILNTKDKAFLVYDMINQLSKELAAARNEEIKTSSTITGAAAGITDSFSETSNLINLAVAAMEREDYDTALDRVREARLALAVEKGRISPAAFLMRYWWIIPIIAILGTLGIFMGYREYTKQSLRRQINDLDVKEQSLLLSIRNAQKKYYDHKTMDRTRFKKEISDLRKQISTLRKDRISLRHKQVKMLRPQDMARILEEERSEISEKLKHLQNKFYIKREISRLDFEEQSIAFEARLAEIDEEKWSITP